MQESGVREPVRIPLFRHGGTTYSLFEDDVTEMGYEDPQPIQQKREAGALVSYSDIRNQAEMLCD